MLIIVHIRTYTFPPNRNDSFFRLHHRCGHELFRLIRNREPTAYLSSTLLGFTRQFADAINRAAGFLNKSNATRGSADTFVQRSSLGEFVGFDYLLSR